MEVAVSLNLQYHTNQGIKGHFKLMKKIILESTLTCPDCNFRRTLVMPEDYCQFFYKCENCGRVLKPQKGDCCVFCSYGSVPCPSKQEELNKK